MGQVATGYVGQAEEGGMEGKIEMGDTLITLEQKDDEIKIVMKEKLAIYLSSSLAAIVAVATLCA